MTYKVPISEIFFSIQGEGKYAGRPSLFIRVGGCNLNCKFNNNRCDSFYAVDKRYESSWTLMSITQLINLIRQYYPCDIVFTGGEPTLYYKRLYPIVELFDNITFETNATIDIDFVKFAAYKDVTFAMSVKLSNSNESYSRRINKKAIYNMATNAKKSFFKFVIDRDLYLEILDIVDSLENDIYCMPMGEDKNTLEQNAPFVFEFCLKYGFCYSDRTHIRLFCKKRGV
ncbi:MAG: 7-carboxy-7-deazaguanine synthase QueE [Epsilonproteobacteria bacterium]|nr:7-carboxy-7-deazaguanine synthase QueE [Campylobacterota bacterium]